MDQNNIYQHPKKQRYLLLIIAVGLVVLAGVWIASVITPSNTTEQTTTSNDGGQPIITDIVIGTPANDEEATRPNPRLTQKLTYNVGELLALRVTLDPVKKRSAELNFRLVDEKRSIIELDPPSITMQAGTSTFCCWTLEKEGQFILQIFRPEGTITSVPLTVNAMHNTRPDASFF